MLIGCAVNTKMKSRLSGLMAVLAIGLAGSGGHANAQQLPVCAANGSASANGSGIVYLQYDVPAPANVAATDGTYVGRVDVTWSAVSSTAKYFVYRDGILISSTDGITANSFSDATPAGFTSYSYTVTATQDGGTSDPGAANAGFAMADGSALALQATDGTVTGKVNLAWAKILGADGYKVHRDGSLIATITGENTLSYSDTSVAGSPASHSYAVSAYKGSLETSQSTDSGYANVVPTSLTGSMTTLVNQASDPYQPTVADSNGTDAFTFSITSQPSHGTATVTNNKIVYTPSADYQGNDTIGVQAVDKGGAAVTGTVSVLVECARPIIYGLDVSEDLSQLVGMAQVDACGLPATTQVQLKVMSGGSDVLSVSLNLTKVDGANNYYSFATDITSLADGTYTAVANMTDGSAHSTSANKQIVVDWNSNTSPSFTNKGAVVVTGTATTESIGNIGVK